MTSTCEYDKSRMLPKPALMEPGKDLEDCLEEATPKASPKGGGRVN